MPATTAVSSFVPKAWLHAAGITRVARVTGLDRTGVEVACAIRPAGHVLQVSQGKGRTFERAVRSAVFEAFELWSAENPDVSGFTWGSASELRQVEEVWGPVELDALVAPQLWSERLVLPWVRARRLNRRGHVWVPAQLVWCPAPELADVGVLVSSWTSNGLGAHTTRDAAIRHGLLELAEREALSRVLPDGWSRGALRGRRLEAPIALLGFESALFDLTPQGWRVPVVGALLRDSRGASLTSGYACRPTLAAACEAALLEAAQSRLTDIHGAREDIAHVGASPEAAAFAFALEPRGARKSRPVRDTLAALTAAVPLDAAVVELTAPHAGVHVVKVLSRDARVSELLR